MSRIHVIIRATVDLDPDAAEVELYEPLQDAAAVGLANAVCAGMSGVVAEVLSCAVLEILEVDDPPAGIGPDGLPDVPGDEWKPLPARAWYQELQRRRRHRKPAAEHDVSPDRPGGPR